MKPYYYKITKDRVRIGINKKITHDLGWKDGDEILQIPSSKEHLVLTNISRLKENTNKEFSRIESETIIKYKDMWTYLLDKVEKSFSLIKTKSSSAKERKFTKQRLAPVKKGIKYYQQKLKRAEEEVIFYKNRIQILKNIEKNIKSKPKAKKTIIKKTGNPS